MADKTKRTLCGSYTAAGVVSGGTVKAGTIDNRVMSDSGTKAIGIAARHVVADQEKNVIQSQNVPNFSQHDSRPNESSKPSLKGSSSIGNDNFWEHVAKMPPGAYGSISEKSVINKNLTSTVTVYGNGRAHGHLSREKQVGGDETETVVHYGTTSTHSEGYVNDDTIFKKFGPSKSGCYKLEKPTCALIINNIFDNNPDPEYTEKYREGATKDSEKMNDLFKNFFKFSFARTEENVCSERLPVILEKFRADVKKYECSSCFIIIMSHGGTAVNSILMDDLTDVDLYNDIVYKFSDHDDVRAIPKVFLVEACRDSQGPPASHSPEAPRDIQDVLVGQSTCPHFPAARHNVTGALYFTVIDEVFRKNAKSSTLCSMLCKVYLDERLKERGQNPPVELYGFQEFRFKLNS